MKQDAVMIAGEIIRNGHPYKVVGCDEGDAESGPIGWRSNCWRWGQLHISYDRGRVHLYRETKYDSGFMGTWMEVDDTLIRNVMQDSPLWDNVPTVSVYHDDERTIIEGY